MYSYQQPIPELWLLFTSQMKVGQTLAFAGQSLQVACLLQFVVSHPPCQSSCQAKQEHSLGWQLYGQLIGCKLNSVLNVEHTAVLRSMANDSSRLVALLLPCLMQSQSGV